MSTMFDKMCNEMYPDCDDDTAVLEEERQAAHMEQMRDLQERELCVRAAIRECVSRGVSMENVYLLCAQTGIRYDDVVG